MIARRRREKPGRKRYKGVKKRLTEIDAREERLNLGLQGEGRSGLTGVDIWSASTLDPDWVNHVADDVFDASPTVERVAEFLKQGNHALFLAVDRDDQTIVGQVRGMVQYQPDCLPQLYLDNLGVSAAWQRQGIGRALVQRLMEWGQHNHDAEGCWLGAEPDNQTAKAFYLALGFNVGPMCMVEKSLV